MAYAVSADDATVDAYKMKKTNGRIPLLSLPRKSQH